MLRTFREFWDTMAPEDVFDKNPTSNLQVVCGRRWGLMVIDLDGEAAIEEWHKRRGGRKIQTWVSHTGGAGRHLWFRVPEQGPLLRKGFLWKGEGEHSAIERLGDKSLVMAYPSIHPKTGDIYMFERGHNPRDIGLMDAPPWLLAWNTIEPPRTPVATPVVRQTSDDPGHGSHRYDADQVKAAIHDKVGLVASWGIRFVNRNNGREWVECHAFDREDTRPSAAVNGISGVYVDSGSGRRLSLFALGVECGAFLDYADAIARLGAQYIVSRL
jgi:hypothetical protein